MKYATSIHGTKDGKGSFATVYRYDGKGWRHIGTSKTMWTYPTYVRARTAGEGIARRYHAQHHPQLPIELHRD